LEGFTEIAIGQDPVAANQWRDPLTSCRVATGARVTLGFLRRQPLPPQTPVMLRYDLAGNGCEREVQGIPRLSHTIMEGDSIAYHYRLAYWLPPHAVMRFSPPYVRQRTEATDSPSENFREVPVAV
jgi:hypothetical protein